jgi:hypothetical protein
MYFKHLLLIHVSHIYMFHVKVKRKTLHLTTFFRNQIHIIKSLLHVLISVYYI